MFTPWVIPTDWWEMTKQWEHLSLPLSLLLLVAFVAYMLHTHSPRYLEKRMARKLEKQRIADIICAAFDQAEQEGKMNVFERIKYMRRLSRGLSLPDLWTEPTTPKPPSYVKAQIHKRLDKMGVNIKEALASMKGRRGTKRISKPVIATLKQEK